MPDAQSPRSPATSPAQYRAGSGVGVSVLLREAHGFEGPLRISESPEVDDLSLAEPINPTHWRVRLHAAGLASVSKSSDRYYEVSDVEHAVHGCLERFECFINIPHVLAHAVVSVIGAALGDHGYRALPLDGRMTQLKEEIEVAPAKRSSNLPDHVHVLLRHRPRSIAQRRESERKSGRRAQESLGSSRPARRL